jgi:hypothetical protein
MRQLGTLLLLATLAACQSQNPYVADSAPLPPAPAHVPGQLDPSAYPAAPRDYGSSTTSSWGTRPRRPEASAGLRPTRTSPGASRS